MSIGPTVQARVLGTRLRELREAAGVKQSAVVTFAGISQSNLSEIEKGKAVPRQNDLPVIARYYGADEATIKELDKLRAGASKHGWWYVYQLADQYALYVGLEADATKVRAAAISLLPGLLQTESYAQKLHMLRGKYTQEEIDQRVAIRMHRQKRLTGKNPLQLTAILDEGVLHRCARDTSVAPGQLQMLMDRARLPNVELLVLPFEAGLHVGQSGAFSLLSFPDGMLPDVCSQEYIVGGHVVDVPSVVCQLDTLFDDRLRGQALDANESLTVIAKLVELTH